MNYFGASCQRSAKLELDRTALDLPKITLANFPDTRVDFIVILFRTLLSNHFLLDGYGGRDTEFQKLWKTLSGTDHRAMQEMEAIMSVCFEYSTNKYQQ